MQQVVIIPEQEWRHYQDEQQDLKKRLSILEKGLTECVNQAEAQRITGLGKTRLYELRLAGKLTDVGEGRNIRYLRPELMNFIEERKPRFMRQA